MVKRISTILVLITILLSSFVLPTNAYEFESEDAIPGGYYLYNFENNLVLAESEIDKIIFPASTVKIMTACIAIEADIYRDKIITITDDMLKDVYGIKMKLKVGDVLTYTDLLYALINYGFNDVAYAIALTVCDSVDEFIDKMNSKAQELGMTSTYYVNITGMYEEGATTSISDIAKLSKYLVNNEEFIKISSQKAYPLSNYATCTTKIINNRSTLFSTFKEFANFNLGTEKYGACNVVYYKKGGLSFLCIVMDAHLSNGQKPDKAAENCTKELLYHAVYDYSLKTIYTNKNVVVTLPVKLTTKSDDLRIYPSEDVTVFLPNTIDIENDLSYTTNIYNGDLVAPIKAGDVVGELIISYDGQILRKVSLVVKDSVDRNSFLHLLDIIKQYISSRSFIFTIISFMLAMVIYYLFKRHKIKKMHKKSSRLGKKSK